MKWLWHLNHIWPPPSAMSNLVHSEKTFESIFFCTQHWPNPTVLSLIPLPTPSVVQLVNPCVCMPWLVNLSFGEYSAFNPPPPPHGLFQTDICAVIPGRSRCDGGWTAPSRPWGRWKLKHGMQPWKERWRLWAKWGGKCVLKCVNWVKTTL